METGAATFYKDLARALVFILTRYHLESNFILEFSRVDMLIARYDLEL